MKYLPITVITGVMALLIAYGYQPETHANSHSISFSTILVGYEEVPALSKPGSGTFRAKVSPDGSSFTYELSYQDLEGDVRQSHIHFGQIGVNGGISIWLCQTTFNPSPVATTPTCENPDNPLDTHSGRVTGTATAADVIGPAGQGIAAGEFAEILKAIRLGVAYANVHSTVNPPGEIRGQIDKPSLLRFHGKD